MVEIEEPVHSLHWHLFTKILQCRDYVAEAGTAAAAIFLRDAVTSGLWGDETEAANVKSFQVVWYQLETVC